MEYLNRWGSLSDSETCSDADSESLAPVSELGAFDPTDTGHFPKPRAHFLMLVLNRKWYVCLIVEYDQDEQRYHCGYVLSRHCWEM